MRVATYFCLLASKQGNYFGDPVLDENKDVEGYETGTFPNDIKRSYKQMKFSGIAGVRQWPGYMLHLSKQGT